MKVHTKQRLRKIYGRTQGKCHICGKKLAWKNYGVKGARGCWSIEHSIPQARGGTHHGNNLYAACMSCNSSKGASSTRTSRAKNGRTRAPLSKSVESKARRKSATTGAGVGMFLGGVWAGPPGVIAGGVIGATLGHSIDPE